ncbi:MAG: GMC family oxidoreductase [Bryobacterales bacterium]|nr:GMC family oxidoreductase [Bryobacterales bacterium]
MIGSGYGGAITAARLANTDINPKPSVCILERGKEWPVGSFPNSAESYAANLRAPGNPLGLYEMLNFDQISVLKGSGLGGTSLVNANVAIRPDKEVFELGGWPKSLTLAELSPYYALAEKTLNVTPHPRAGSLAKVQALERRAVEIGTHAEHLPLAVNFTTGPNPQGVHQEACTDCGDCVSGCNVSAKNTLYMNYLPLARQGGAEIFTQVKVESIEKTANGWLVHGRWQETNSKSKKFTIAAGNVILAAGSINSTEILLRSAALNKLSVSPALGTRFGGNGDFFGLSYNGDHRANTLGFGTPPVLPPQPDRPGPSIVALVRHNSGATVLNRFAIEDLSFPSAAVRAAQIVFPLAPREDTDSGDETAERRRIDRDVLGRDPLNGALNHTMLYLCMGFDDARGTFEFERPFFERDGRIRIRWDGVGEQQVFARINAEIRRHARAQGGSFVENPLWSFPGLRRLITAHPLGGCPMSDDFTAGATDSYGRVYQKDGTVHTGLFVADGALLPSALGVNPFLTISAVAERIAAKIIANLKGEAYPAPPVAVGFSQLSAIDVAERREAELERIFQSAPSLEIGVMMNQGGPASIDAATKSIRNDDAWKGFFPKHHILNQMSGLLYTGFQKRFRKEGSRFTGLTSDTDGRIRARNSLEQLDLTKQTGDLAPGRYILLQYLDPPWQGFYDVFKVIHKDLLIGRVYLGSYPNGRRMFTFPMTRTYGFHQMKVDDHRALWDSESVTIPTKEQLAGVWRMDVISNANQAGGIARLTFDLKPDGRLESRYQLAGLIEGLVLPSFTANHFQLTDFTGFHDEIRRVDADTMIGKWVMELPPEASALPAFGSLGIFHQEAPAPGDRRPRFGFYYLLSRTGESDAPTNTLLAPWRDAQLPAGLQLEFQEEMDGWYFPGQSTPGPGREADLTLASRDRNGAIPCRFKLNLRAADLNEFVDGAEHEARAEGTLTFARFGASAGEAVFTLDASRSTFQYLRVNPATGEAEMRYHLEFDDPSGVRHHFDGRKYMQKDEAGGIRGFQELMEDYTTLYVHVTTPHNGAETGTAYLRFRTFENIAAFRSLTQFLSSFRVTGTADPLLRLRGQMKFAAFTGQFIQREYDPAGVTTGALREDVRTEVVRGAAEADFFSTQTGESLQAILRAQPTLPLDSLINTRRERVDVARRRIWRDVFWKGSFAKDSLAGGEERLRNSAIAAGAASGAFTSGAFWKRFDAVTAAGLTGHVVNYDLHWLPGKPIVREVAYPNATRRYFDKGDKVLLLTYTNEPYRVVYDTIKVIDENSAVGVMHLGEFPDGIEFATFVMERHNYPFELMSREDYRLLASDAFTRVPTAAEAAGEWTGRLISLAHPNLSLMRKPNPVRMEGAIDGNGAARFRLGGLAEPWSGGPISGLRLVDADMLIGRWDLGVDLGWLAALQDCVEPDGGRFWAHFVLTRKR